MSYENPTPLRVGATGTLHGWSATVAGRVVLGVDLEGERYTWNEYNLVDAKGQSATLVHEEAEAGAEWKLFQLLATPPPMTVAEAATKRVGDRVSFGGPPIPVTLVDRSRVYHIEGTAPEGVEVGDLADFFNADAGDHMIVASWTGGEIEFYEGRDVSAATVAAAFGLPREEESFQISGQRGPGPNVLGTRFLRAVGGAIALLVATSYLTPRCHREESGRTGPRPTAARPAPVARFARGDHTVLRQQAFSIAAQARVAVGRVGGRYERYEYQLNHEGQKPALLINGLTGGTRQWHLLQPARIPAGFTAYTAATLRRGNPVDLDGATATVQELFLSQPRQVDAGADRTAWPAGRQYGFVAVSGNEWWLARWDERGVSLHHGPALAEIEILAREGASPPKSK